MVSVLHSWLDVAPVLINGRWPDRELGWGTHGTQPGGITETFEFAKLLVECGAKLNQTNLDGDTALIRVGDEKEPLPDISLSRRKYSH